MKKTLRQELEYNNQPQYRGSNYPSIADITYGGSCPLPTQDASKVKMLNGGYGFELQKHAQEKVAKNLRWLNNSYESLEEEHKSSQEDIVDILEGDIEQVEEDLTPKSKQIKEMQEQMLIFQKMLEEKDNRIQELESNTQIIPEDLISKTEVEEIMEKNDTEKFQLIQSNETLQQENMTKDDVINSQAQTISEQTKNLSHSNQIIDMQKHDIQDLREDKIMLREQVQELKGKNITLEHRISDFEEITEAKNQKIDELQNKLQEVLLNNPSSDIASSEYSIIGNEDIDIAGQIPNLNEDMI